MHSFQAGPGRVVEGFRDQNLGFQSVGRYGDLGGMGVGFRWIWDTMALVFWGFGVLEFLRATSP